jgi:Flp pilus assembly protein TadB
MGGWSGANGVGLPGVPRAHPPAAVQIRLTRTERAKTTVPGAASPRQPREGFESAQRRCPARYAVHMETEAPRRPPLLRRVLAVLVLVAAAALAIHLVIGLVMAVFWVVVVLLVAVAVLWALKTVVW